MTTNSLKAEKILNFKDKTYKARMSVDTIIRIEQALGCSIFKVGAKLASTDLTLSETVTILTLAIRAGGNDVSDKDIVKLIGQDGIGILEAMKLSGELLTIALNVDPDDTEKKSNP